MMLLTDGTVFVQGGGVSKNFYKLTPDSTGNYTNGTWTTLAPMSVERQYTGSVVMPNGKVFVIGGELSGPLGLVNQNNTAAIYDPQTDSWSAAPPFPQATFGDGQAVLLKNGKILCGYQLGLQCYLYDPTTNTWSPTGNKIHDDINNEETWLQLPDGSILSYDIAASPSVGAGKAQRYLPASGTWIDAGVVPVPLSSAALVGAGSLLPNGRLMLIGGNGNTVFYNLTTNSWSIGPSLPVGMGADDAPACMLPNGHLVFTADSSAPLFTGPSKLYDFNPTTNTLTDITPGGAVGAAMTGPAYFGRMLMLPNGNMLFNTGGGTIYEYTPDGVPQPSWAPAITVIGQTAVLPVPIYTIAGTQLTGISEGATYGNDAGMSTNYPIVRLRNQAGVVKYARTFNWTPGVATKTLSTTVQFTMPAGFPAGGTYQVAVIANGIASPEVSIGGSLYALKDIFAGSNGSEPKYLTDVNGTLFFTATDGLKGTELWKSDGTEAGTVLVKDIRLGSAGSDPSNLINVNGTLYFTANDAVKGLELWKSDGTANGTVRVADIRVGVGSSTPTQLTNVNGTLYFQANNGVKGVELWKSNGTAATTVMVKDIRLGVLGSSPTNLINFNNTLYFVANDGVSGAELWKTDGTSGGTTLVRDIRSGLDTSAPAKLTLLGSTLYFTANNGTTGTELWRTDGTTGGTSLVKDIDTRTFFGSNPTFLTVLNGKLYFQATKADAQANSGAELWTSDGTTAGTKLVSDLNPGAAGSVPSNLFAFNGALYFQASHPVLGTELWKHDPTTGITALFKDINTTALNASYPSNFVNVQGTMYFTANEGITGYELWQSDGTAVGTRRTSDIKFSTASSFPSSLVNSNGKLFFSADDGFSGFELWMI